MIPWKPLESFKIDFLPGFFFKSRNWKLLNFYIYIIIHVIFIYDIKCDTSCYGNKAKKQRRKTQKVGWRFDQLYFLVLEMFSNCIVGTCKNTLQIFIMYHNKSNTEVLLLLKLKLHRKSHRHFYFLKRPQQRQLFFTFSFFFSNCFKVLDIL